MRSSLFSALLALSVIIVPFTQGADSERGKRQEVRPSWSALPGVDGHNHSLAELHDKEVVVVAITCNHCPIAIEYFSRLNAFARQHCSQNGKVALVAISVSDLETDKLPRMKEFSHRHEFQFPYLHDASQRIAKDLDATVTPQFFVLDRDRRLAYRGAWDDSVNAEKVKSRYVDEVVGALLAGQKPEVSETRARGCLIHYRK